MRRGALGACCAALVVAALQAGPAAALGKPDWAEPFLDRPTPRGPYIAKNDGWVVVYGEVEIGLRGDHFLEQRHRLILENVGTGPQAFVATVVYDEGQQQLTDLALNVQRRIWHEINLEKKALQASVPGAQQVLVAAAEKIEPGKRVVFEYTLGDTLGFNPWTTVTIPGAMPAAEMRYWVSATAAARGVRFSLVTPGGAPPPPSFTREESGAWRVTAIPAMGRIRTASLVYQPTVANLLPYFLATVGGSTADSFTTYAAHYAGAWRDRVGAIDAAQVAAQAATLTGGAKGWLDKAYRLTGFVQREIHYDASNIKSIESWLPLSTQETLRSRKGDCKGKVMLLQALLAAVGIESVPVLVRSDASYYSWGDEVGTAFFNHVILAVKPPEAAEPLPARLTGGPLAGWVLVDATAETAAFGAPIPGFEGRPALAMTTVPEPVFTIRTSTPSESLCRIAIDWTLEANGSASARVSAEDNGTSPAVFAAITAAAGAERTKLLARTISSELPAATVTACEASPADGAERPLATLAFAFASPNVTQRLTSSVLAVSPVAVGARIAGLTKGFDIAPKPDPDDVIELSPPWDARFNVSGVDLAVEIDATVHLPADVSWPSPPSRHEDRPWVKFDQTWTQDATGTWIGKVVLRVPRGEWAAAGRRERLGVMDELLTSLYAPQVLSAAASP